MLTRGRGWERKEEKRKRKGREKEGRRRKKGGRRRGKRERKEKKREKKEKREGEGGKERTITTQKVIVLGRVPLKNPPPGGGGVQDPEILLT